MIHIKKYILTLAALFAMTVGAWADEVTIGDPNATTSNGYLPSYTLYDYSLTQQIYTADEIGMEGTITALTMWLQNTSSYARNYKIYMKEVYMSAFATNTDWVSMTDDDLVATGTLDNGIGTFAAKKFTLTKPFVYSGEGNLLICFADVTGDWSSGAYSNAMAANGNQAMYVYRDGTAYDVTTPGVNGTMLSVKSVVRLDIISTDTKVTINDDKNEATFEMPANDIEITYNVKRDMRVDVNAVMPSYIRMETTQANGIRPVDETQMHPKVTDVIDAENPVELVEYTDFIPKLQKLADDGETWNDVETISIGTFRMLIIGNKEGHYADTTYTNVYKLYLPYEVTVPAGEYATFYKDDNICVDPEASENARLYTIESISNEEIVLSGKLDIVPANTPMLVYNAGQEEKTYLLIPTDEDADEVTAAPEFKGTLKAMTLDASDDEKSVYAFNGLQFVFVKYAINIAANKGWLEIPTGNMPAARALSIVFGDATGVGDELKVENGEHATWYTLDGRKLDNMPAKKGIYIMNGKKVVIK